MLISVVDSLSIALYFVIIGYMFLLFCYFMFIRFRKTKKLYWFYFSLFFLFLLVSRALFIVYDYYMKIWILDIRYNGSNLPIVIYRLASFTGYAAAGMVVGILATLLFTKENKLHKSMAYLLPAAVILIASMILWLPAGYVVDPKYYWYVLNIAEAPVEIIPSPIFGDTYPAGLFYLNYIGLPILNFALPCIFFYLAAKSVGVIRKSSLLNGLGLIIYYIGRSIQPLLKFGENVLVQAFVPAIIILFGLILIALANFMLQS
ncbi:MAG: hypothetical protein EU530_01015 [Promethearchaeota archaeon]|nr:MAG: hypothetical protein EU530_01015 [Candidatus Lokiarchaeota archaeon]